MKSGVEINLEKSDYPSNLEAPEPFPSIISALITKTANQHNFYDCDGCGLLWMPLCPPEAD